MQEAFFSKRGWIVLWIIQMFSPYNFLCAEWKRHGSRENPRLSWMGNWSGLMNKLKSSEKTGQFVHWLTACSRLGQGELLCDPGSPVICSVADSTFLQLRWHKHVMDKPKGSFEAEATLEDHTDYLISLSALEEGMNNFFLRSHQIRRFYSLEREE